MKPKDRTKRDWTDPTRNVRNLNRAGLKHEKEMRELEAKWVRRFLKQQWRHGEEMRRAEKERLNAIRNVDQSNVQRDAEAVIATAETLRKDAATAAERVREAITAEVEPLKKDIATLSQNMFETVGKGQAETVQKTNTISTQTLAIGCAALLVSAVIGFLGLMVAVAAVIVSLTH